MQYVWLTVLMIWMTSYQGVIAQDVDPQTLERVRGLLDNIFHDNDEFVRTSTEADFKVYHTQQHPRATIVMCCDSRVQTTAIDKTPKNDLFIVRNIGNQVHSNRGSVEYGVRHIHTPVLLIIGHVGCGAIKAAQGDYSAESEAIRKELDSLHVDKKTSGEQAVIDNVHTQVTDALNDYADLVKEKKLFIFGAVYDFRNELKQGEGRLVLVNYNGEKDIKVIKETPILAGIDNIKIGPAKG